MTLETAKPTIQQKTSQWVMAMGVICAVAVTLVVGVAAALLLFAHPQADDLWACKISQQWGFRGAMCWRYLYWQGRWMSGIMEHGLAALGDIRAQYPYILGGIWLIAAIAMFRVVSTMFDQTRLSLRLVVAIALLAVYWAGMPAPGQVLYWTSGGLEHFLPLLLTLINLCLLLNGPSKSAWSRAMITPLVAVLSFITPGINEMWACITLMLLTAGVVLAFWMKHPNRYLWLMAIILWTSSLAIVVLSPGNAVRMRAEGGRHGDWKLTLWQIGRRVPKWISWRVILGVVVLVSLQQAGILKGRWQARERWRWIGLTLLLWIAVTVAGFGIPSAILGRSIPDRVLDTIMLAFFIGLFALIAQCSRVDVLAKWFERPLGQMAMGILIGIFALSILGAGHFREGLRDLLVRAPRYNRAMNDRFRQIENHARTDIDLVVPDIADYPKSFFQNDITTDVRNYRNWHVAYYFGIRTVRTRGTGDSGFEKNESQF